MAQLALTHELFALGFVLGAAFLAGFIDSIVGGGGLIQVPALFAGFPSMTPTEILATNKIAGICGTGNAVFRYRRFLRLPWKSLLPAAGIAFLAGLGGASLVSRVSPTTFKPLVPIMLFLVLAYVVFYRDLGAAHSPKPASRRRALVALSGICAIGVYDGFFGPGTGSFLLLLFMRIYGFDFLHASASARVINVATNAGGLVYFGFHTEMHWVLGLVLGVSNASGSLLGITAARRHGVAFVRIAFIVVVLLLIAKTARDALA